MRRESLRFSILAATLLGACSTQDGPVEPADSAGRTDLITFDVPGVGRAFALDINDGGMIVGRYRGDDDQVHGFVRYQNGEIATIDVPDAVFTVTAGINDRGDIVGQYALPDAPDDRHGFLLRDGVFTPLDPDGSVFTNALGINDRGDVTGRTLGADDEFFHGFRLRGGVFSIIDAPDAVETHVWRSTRSGTMVGGYLDSDDLAHLFVLNGAGFKTRELPADAALSLDNGDINSRGDIVGTWCDEAPCGVSPEGTHGFLLTADGRFTSIDVPDATSTATFGVNELGDIVGGYFDGDGTLHGFLLRH